MVSDRVNDHGYGLAIRVGAAVTFELSKWFNEEEVQILLDALATKKNILVAGGTSSGKTTFLNSLLRLVDMDERIITIEDARELVITQKNHTAFLKAKSGTDIARISYIDLINSAMRMRPDRIILGELDIQNSLPFLRILNTGHGGSMATVHADGVDEALEAIALNVSLSGQGTTDSAATLAYVKKAIDIVVHLHRVDRTTYEAKLEKIK
jgi:type IV secretion system protein VirB11